MEDLKFEGYTKGDAVMYKSTTPKSNYRIVLNKDSAWESFYMNTETDIAIKIDVTGDKRILDNHITACSKHWNDNNGEEYNGKIYNTMELLDPKLQKLMYDNMPVRRFELDNMRREIFNSVREYVQHKVGESEDKKEAPKIH